MIQYVPLVFPDMRPVTETVGPFREQVIATCNTGIALKDRRHVTTCNKIEVSLRSSIIDIEPVRIRISHIEITLPRAIIVYSPTLGTDHERHRYLRQLIRGPHTEKFSPVLNMIP